MNEFEIIQRYFAQPTLQRSDVILGCGDDGAIVQIPSGHQLVVSIDTLIESVHFPINTAAYDIGYKSLAVNLSDLAAMGAEPTWATMALTLPDNNESWLQEFSRGFFDLANFFNVQLIGGDLTCGPVLTITVQAHGIVPSGAALRRDGATVGDSVYITGTVGDAGLALQLQKLQQTVPTDLLARLNRPLPRIAAGIALRKIAHSAIDISDGLVADLNHILENSHVGATINLDRIPVSKTFNQNSTATQLLPVALTSGDDYELCFTVPAQHEAALKIALNKLDCGYQKIGVIEKTPGLRLLNADGSLLHLNNDGYMHF